MDKGKIKIFFKFLLFFLLVQNFYFTTIADAADDCSGITDNSQGSCYMAYDFGFSTGSIIIESKCIKDANGKNKCQNSKDPKCG